jgi:hypothetical protein
MTVSKLYKLREELKQLVEVARIPKKDKERWLKLIPKMLPSELVELRRNLLEQLVLDAQSETIGEIKKGNKEVPDDDKGLIEFVLGKVLSKVDQVEVRSVKALAK